MRNRIIAAFLVVWGLAPTILEATKRLVDFVGIIHLPNDLREILMKSLEIPEWYYYFSTIIGVTFAAYLTYEIVWKDFYVKRRSQKTPTAKQPEVEIEYYTNNPFPCVFYVEEYTRNIKLKLLPDTRYAVRDAIGLIIFAYYKFFAIDGIPEELVRLKLLEARSIAPNTPHNLSLSNIDHSIITSLNIGDMILLCVNEGMIERIALSTGGRLRLTQSSKERMETLARDLQRRS